MKTGGRIDAYKGFSHITRIRQELQEQDSGKNLRIKESYKNYKKKRIRQEFKNTRILAGGTSLALPAKLRSTWFLPES